MKQKEPSRVLLLMSATEEESRQNQEINPPYCLYFLATALRKKKNYEVRIKDYLQLGESFYLDDLKKQLLEFRPQFVGISMLTMNRVSGYKAINLIKEFDKNIKVILGGIHATIMYEQILKNFPVDAICVGEADETIVELLDAFKRKKSLRKINGVAYLEKEKVIFNGRRKLIENLDKLPFVNYDDYFKENKSKKIGVFTSRGCPFMCSFCSSHLQYGRTWRSKSYKKVVDEIEFLINRYPWLETIDILDDNSTVDNARMISLCKEIIKRGINKKFTCQGKIKPVSREMFYWMKKAGFYELRFGVESGSNKILELCHKGITKEDIRNTFTILKEFDFEVVRHLIAGLPGETEETIDETIEFLKELQKMTKMAHHNSYIPVIFPGTELFDICKKKGIIDESYWLTDKPCPYFTAEHSFKWLVKMSNRISLRTTFDMGFAYTFRKITKKLITIGPRYYVERFLLLKRKE